MSATQTLARFIAGTEYDSLPAPVVDAAKIAILDGVANMAAGSVQELSDIIGRYVRDSGGRPKPRWWAGATRPIPRRRPSQRGLRPLFGLRDSRVPAHPRHFVLLAGCLGLGEQHQASGKQLSPPTRWDGKSRGGCGPHRPPPPLRRTIPRLGGSFGRRGGRGQDPWAGRPTDPDGLGHCRLPHRRALPLTPAPWSSPPIPATPPAWAPRPPSWPGWVTPPAMKRWSPPWAMPPPCSAATSTGTSPPAVWATHGG